MRGSALARLAYREREAATDRGGANQIRNQPGNAQATVIPIERAVPAMMRSAASTSLALRSFIFSSAISRNCFLVIWPAVAFAGV